MFLSMHYPPKNKVEVSLCNLADFVSGIVFNNHARSADLSLRIKKQRHSDEKPSEWHFAIRYEITGWRLSIPFRA